MRTSIAALLIALILASCREDPPPRVEPAFDTRRFLETWLVERDLEAAGQAFAPDYDRRPAGDLSMWPQSLRQLPRRERALQYPFESGCGACTALEECVAGGEPGRPWEEAEVDVGDTEITSVPELAAYRGRKLRMITFMMKECPVATMLLHDGREVAALAYVPRR